MPAPAVNPSISYTRVTIPGDSTSPNIVSIWGLAPVINVVSTAANKFTISTLSEGIYSIGIELLDSVTTSSPYSVLRTSSDGTDWESSTSYLTALSNDNRYVFYENITYRGGTSDLYVERTLHDYVFVIHAYLVQY